MARYDYYGLQKSTKVFSEGKYKGDIKWSRTKERWQFVPIVGEVTIWGSTIAEVKAKVDEQP